MIDLKDKLSNPIDSYTIKLLSNGSGAVYFYLSREEDDSSSSVVIYRIDLKTKSFEPIYSVSMILEAEKNSEADKGVKYNPIILKNGDLAILELCPKAFLRLWRFDSKDKSWKILWKHYRVGYGNMLALLPTPHGQFILMDENTI